MCLLILLTNHPHFIVTSKSKLDTLKKNTLSKEKGKIVDSVISEQNIQSL